MSCCLVHSTFLPNYQQVRRINEDGLMMMKVLSHTVFYFYRRTEQSSWFVSRFRGNVDTRLKCSWVKLSCWSSRSSDRKELREKSFDKYKGMESVKRERNRLLRWVVIIWIRIQCEWRERKGRRLREKGKWISMGTLERRVERKDKV